ncbi:MAG: hypothetical protein Q8O05_03045 [Chloroflexota bacterium]|nr:hypothetical protein [Chloroflexota bacterium]
MRKLAPFIPVLLILLVGLGAGCSNGFVAQEKGNVSPAPLPIPYGSPTNGLVQTSSGGGVTIDVEWRGLKDGLLVFGVTMDTHSGSLDQYNLRDLAILRDSSGTEYRPNNWDAPPGGHHREGILTFPVADSLNLRTVKYVELILRDTAGVKERGLKWQLD